MNITLKPCPSYVRMKTIKKYVRFAQAHGYSLDDREINPIHVIKWVIESASFQEFNGFKSQKFKNCFYYLMKNSKYPMSLFLKLSHVKKLASSCQSVDVDFLEVLFKLFLEGSKQFATNPEGRELLQNLPWELPENKEAFKGWFLSDTNKCFTMQSVIDFYIWVSSQKLRLDFNCPSQLIEASNNYLMYMKNTYSRDKYKNKRTYISYVIQLFQPREERPELLNQETLALINKFLDWKLNSINITYHGRIISDLPWKASNVLNSEHTIKKFFERIIIIKGYSENEAKSFSPYSITLDDVIEVKKGSGLQKNWPVI